jgi:hypothetical protein
MICINAPSSIPTSRDGADRHRISSARSGFGSSRGSAGTGSPRRQAGRRHPIRRQHPLFAKCSRRKTRQRYLRQCEAPEPRHLWPAIVAATAAINAPTSIEKPVKNAPVAATLRAVSAAWRALTSASLALATTSSTRFWASAFKIRSRLFIQRHANRGGVRWPAQPPKLARQNFRRSNRARQVCKDSPLEQRGFELLVPPACATFANAGHTLSFA